MRILEEFVLTRSERHLERYRNAARGIRVGFREEYESFLPQIERSYREAGYWHGTGRYHYWRRGDARYKIVGADSMADVVESILRNRAITSHQDLWTATKEQHGATVSVAPSRMHARLYAHAHLRDGVWLEYVFGGTRFWMGYFLALMGQDLFFTQSRAERQLISRIVFNRSSLQHFRTWASSIRNLDQYRILPLWRAYDLRSDIPGNYAVLFGIKRSAIHGDGVLPCLKKVEIRIDRPISLDDVTHVEVPFANVEETRALLATHAMSLPVIPLEFGELYCSQFPLSSLV